MWGRSDEKRRGEQQESNGIAKASRRESVSGETMIEEELMEVNKAN